VPGTPRAAAVALGCLLAFDAQRMHPVDARTPRRRWPTGSESLELDPTEFVAAPDGITHLCYRIKP
jgi:hypothetical protein